MGQTGTDGKAYTSAEQERLTRALFSLSVTVYQFPPATLDRVLLQDWQARLSDHHPRMQPGQLRVTDVTFGSYYGTAPRDIPAQLSTLIDEVNARLSQLEQLPSGQEPEQEDVVRPSPALSGRPSPGRPHPEGHGHPGRLNGST